MMAKSLRNRIRFVDLPLLGQELRVRQRGAKPFVVMFIYVTVLAAAGALFSLTIGRLLLQHSHQGNPTAQMAMIGKSLFTVLMLAQLALIALIVPAYSSGAVTTERERGTFELLVLTLLSSSTIVVQKLAAAIGQAVMLIVVSVPVVSLVFLLGGVSPTEIAVAYGVLMAEAALFGTLGLFCSCRFRNTRASTFAAYLVVLGFLAGLPLLGHLLNNMNNSIRMGDTGFSLTVVGTLAFVSGVMALMIYATVSLWAKRTQHWRSRSFRMAIFGAIYAAMSLLMSSPAWQLTIIDAMFSASGDMFLPLFVHPFVAIYQLMFGDPYGAFGGIQNWVIGATLVFAIACTYLFKQLSAFRFDRLRKSGA